MELDHIKKLFAKVGGDTLLDCLAAECPDFAHVIYRRNHERWAVGYLLEKLPSGGCRLLSQDPELRLHRVRVGADVIVVDAVKHGELVKLYREFQEAVTNAIASPSRKGLRYTKGSESGPRKSNEPRRRPGVAQESR